MYSVRTARSGAARSLRTTIAVALAAAVIVALPAGLLAEEPTDTPEVTATAEPSVTPAEAACESVDDLTLIVEFLQDTDVEEDGWAPVLVGAIAGISEARTLAGSVAETYRPLIDDLIVSLESIRSTVDELSELETTGAQIASVGETIAEVGNAMDAISTQLREPCPND